MIGNSNVKYDNKAIASQMNMCLNGSRWNQRKNSFCIWHFLPFCHATLAPHVQKKNLSVLDSRFYTKFNLDCQLISISYSSFGSSEVVVPLLFWISKGKNKSSFLDLLKVVGNNNAYSPNGDETWRFTMEKSVKTSPKKHKSKCFTWQNLYRSLAKGLTFSRLHLKNPTINSKVQRVLFGNI